MQHHAYISHPKSLPVEKYKQCSSSASLTALSIACCSLATAGGKCTISAFKNASLNVGHRDRVHRVVVDFGERDLRGRRIAMRRSHARSNEANSSNHRFRRRSLLALVGPPLPPRYPFQPR